MSIWGSKRVSSLQYTPLHVLPSFKISLQSKNFNVGYEISLSIQRVVRKFGAEQDYITWDVIMDMAEQRRWFFQLIIIILQEDFLR